MCRQAVQLLQSDACDTRTSTVAHAPCMGADAMFMQEGCMNLASLMLQLDATDVAASAFAWNAVHDKCGSVSAMVWTDTAPAPAVSCTNCSRQDWHAHCTDTACLRHP